LNAFNYLLMFTQPTSLTYDLIKTLIQLTSLRTNQRVFSYIMVLANQWSSSAFM